MSTNQNRNPHHYVKVYGERNTGTNYLTKLVQSNFDVSLLVGAFPRKLNHWPLKNEFVRDSFFRVTYNHTLGWKHACLPSAEAIARSKRKDVALLALVKNPYSWLLSMYKRPYHGLDNSLAFEDFITSPWPILDRENCPRKRLNLVELWGIKNASYSQLENYPRGMLVKFEDLLHNPQDVCLRMGKTLKIPASNEFAQNVEQASKKQDADLNFDYYKDYYLGEKWKEKLSDNQISVINAHLDKTLSRKLGYEIL